MKILIHGRAFPVAMWRWFDWSLRDMGHEVFSVGNYNGGKIPWGDQFDYPQYAFPPDHQIPEGDYPIEALLKEIDFKPDVIIQAADTIYLTGKAPCKNVILETDPHAVDYTPRLQYADHVFCMQDCYKLPGQTWIPYGWYPPIHKYISNTHMAYDVVFSGLQYDHRKTALEAMQAAGLNVLTTLGLVYDEYVQVYNSGLIAFNWSSKNDLPARFWEGMAMGRLVLTNKVPDMALLPHLKDGVHYVTFDSVENAVEKAKYYVENPLLARKIGLAAMEAIQYDTYYERCATMIKVINKL